MRKDATVYAITDKENRAMRLADDIGRKQEGRNADAKCSRGVTRTRRRRKHVANKAGQRHITEQAFTFSDRRGRRAGCGRTAHTAERGRTVCCTGDGMSGCQRWKSRLDWHRWCYLELVPTYLGT